MRRLTLIATLLLLALPAWAQRGGRGGMSGRGGFAPRGSMMGRSGGRFGSTSFIGVGFRNGFGFGNGFNGRFGGRFGNRFHHRRFFGGWGYGYSIYGGYYPWLDTYSFDQEYAAGVSSVYQYNQQALIEQRLDRIEDRVDELLDRLQSRAPQAPPPPPPQSQARPEPSSAATFVFRDGHSEQVQNYAIVGQTLWIFSEDHARKVPLAQINPDATDKANEQRGIDLHLPRG